MRYFVGFVVVAVALASSASAQASEEGERLSETSGARTTSLSTELRFRIFAPSYRWSQLESTATLPSNGLSSFHFVPAVGVRFYPKNGHGALADVDYRMDLDADRGFFSGEYALTNFTVAHVGYAYRYVIPSEPGRRAWALTPHASLSAGASFTEPRLTNASFLERSPVVGGLFGFDVDLHIKRFFLGWTVRYEILRHSKGSLRLSQFVSWNVIPLFAMGAVIGRKVQALQGKEVRPTVNSE